jgi:hypothetical protein
MMTPSEVLAGVDLKSLTPGSLIDVETKSRHYQIECLGGNAIRISGHPDYCPHPVPAQLQGSIDQEGELELGLIGSGMRMKFFLNDHRPVTWTLRRRRKIGDPSRPISLKPRSRRRVN